MNGSDRDAELMLRALELALGGWGRVSPNPMVGALVVKDGRIVSEGFHAEWGGPHAESAALEAAGRESEGSTLYVTLEPCSHTGKTAPCTEAILRAGVKRVVFAIADPSPVAGGGGAWLVDQGIEVVSGVCERSARQVNAAYMIPLETRRPYVALKYALSLDARLSERAGCETRVTSEAARVEAHRLRAGHDAIMVGIETALVDDPELTVRDAPKPRMPPIRIVIDTKLRTPVDSKLVRDVESAPVWVVTSETASRATEAELAERGVEVIRVPAGPRGVDLEFALDELFRRGAHSIVCEGGGRLGSSLLAEARVDRLYTFYAPRLFGEDGVPAFQSGAASGLREFELVERKALGPDTLLVFSALRRRERGEKS